MSTRHLTLIQQNDTHAHLEEHWEHFWVNGRAEYRRAGGIARAATMIREIRTETRDACVLVDCGDTIHGTGPAQWTEGRAVVPVMNALGPALMTPGNWEFGFGPAALRQRAAQLSFPIVACNVTDAQTGALEFQPSLVLEVGGIRAGFVGVTSPIVVETMPKPFGAGLRMAAPADALAPEIARLRREERVHVVVVVSHVGLPQDIQIVKDVPGIDVVLSSHTHNRLTEPVRAAGALLIQSGFSGSFLGRLDLEVTDGRISGASHRLLPIDPSSAAAADIDELVHGELQPFRDRLAEVVGRTETPLHRMTVLEATMDNVLTESYRDLTGADVALSHGWRYGAPIVPGNVTVGDLWQMVPTNPEVFTTSMTGEEIRARLEESLESVYAADARRQKGGYVIRTAGLHAIVRLNNPAGTRVEQLDIAGAPVRDDREYRVAAAGSQDVDTRRTRVNTGIRAVEALRRYFARHSPVSAELTHTRFVAV